MVIGRVWPSSLSPPSRPRYNGAAGDWTNVERRILRDPSLAAPPAPARPCTGSNPPDSHGFASVGCIHPTPKNHHEPDEFLEPVSRRAGERSSPGAGVDGGAGGTGDDTGGVRRAGPAGLVQGQAGPGVAASRVLVDRRGHDPGDEHPGDLRGDGAQEPVVRQEPLRVRPEPHMVGAGAGQGVARPPGGRRGPQGEGYRALSHPEEPGGQRQEAGRDDAGPAFGGGYVASGVPAVPGRPAIVGRGAEERRAGRSAAAPGLHRAAG